MAVPPATLTDKTTNTPVKRMRRSTSAGSDQTGMPTRSCTLSMGVAKRKIRNISSAWARMPMGKSQAQGRGARMSCSPSKHHERKQKRSYRRGSRAEELAHMVRNARHHGDQVQKRRGHEQDREHTHAKEQRRLTALGLAKVLLSDHLQPASQATNAAWQRDNSAAGNMPSTSIDRPLMLTAMRASLVPSTGASISGLSK